LTSSRQRTIWPYRCFLARLDELAGWEKASLVLDLLFHAHAREWSELHRRISVVKEEAAVVALPEVAPASREALFKRFRGLDRESCPFQNLPESGKGRWGEGLTDEDMSKCRWLAPRLVAAIEFAEWTSTGHLRHSKFIALREDKDASEVRREAAIEA
jgi:ATP dependent DNA ligase C terminal region